MAIGGPGLVRGRLDLNASSECGHRAQVEARCGEGEDTVERGREERRDPPAERSEAGVVLAGDEGADLRLAVADDMRRLAPDDVEQLTVEEEQAVDAARHPRLDQHLLGLARGQEHRPAQLQLGADARGGADPAPRPPGGLDHHALGVLAQEPQRRAEAAHVAQDVLGNRDAGGCQELMGKRLLERRAQR